MITNIVTLKAKPGMEGEMAELLKSYIAQISDEEGTLTYTLLQAKKDPTEFIFYEVYKDKAAMELHGSTPLFKEVMMEKVVPFLAGKPQMTFCDIVASKE
ncbi:MAG: antibiotic biosynthesis monooxygenase [Syntrophomonadaceae bacterium]|nr:antibiotic biosynthesis monooxygenase [Syntrophomonadaceae bacterium]